MFGLLIAIIYLDIGLFLTERRVFEIALNNLGDPNDTWGALRLILVHAVTWPMWVFLK